jgi:hypothetical protein
VLGATAAALAALLVGGIWLLRPRPTVPETAAPVPASPGPAAPGEENGKPASEDGKPAPAGDTAAAPAATPPTATAAAVPLTSAAPAEDEVQRLLEAWLTAKAAVLGGRDASVPLEAMARSGPIADLRAERSGDAGRGETQVVKVTIRNLRITERSPRRIAAVAEIDYSDSRRNSAGETVERTPATTLRNEYVFGRDGDRWRLVAYSAAD